MKTENRKIVLRKLPIEIEKKLQCLRRFRAALVKEIKTHVIINLIELSFRN